MPLFIPTEEVARRLDMTAPAFLRHRATLHDLHGLPQPLAGFSRPLRWRESAVTAWLAAFHAGRPLAPPLADPLPPNVRMLRQAALVN